MAAIKLTDWNLKKVQLLALHVEWSFCGHITGVILYSNIRFFSSMKIYFDIFNHLRLCLATVIHNLKWLKFMNICLIWDQIFKKLDI